MSPVPVRQKVPAHERTPVREGAAEELARGHAPAFSGWHQSPNSRRDARREA